MKKLLVLIFILLGSMLINFNSNAQYPVNRSGVSIVDGGFKAWESGGFAYDIDDTIFVNEKIYRANTLHSSSLVFDDDLANWTELSANLVFSVNTQVGDVVLNSQDIPFDNAISGMTATTVKTAIEENYTNHWILNDSVDAQWISINSNTANKADTVTTTDGDLIYRNTVDTRLGIGTEGQILTVETGFPVWKDPVTVPFSPSETDLVHSMSYEADETLVGACVACTAERINTGIGFPNNNSSLSISRAGGGPFGYTETVATDSNLEGLEGELSIWINNTEEVGDVNSRISLVLDGVEGTTLGTDRFSILPYDPIDGIVWKKYTFNFIFGATSVGVSFVNSAFGTIPVYGLDLLSIKIKPPIEPSPTTTQGDLILRGLAEDERLPIGTANQVLTSNGTTASWEDPSGGSGIPLLGKGSLLTSDGVTNGEFAACADNEIIVYDSLEVNGFKCEAKPTTGSTICQTKTLSANTDAFGVISELSFNGLTVGKTYRITGQLRQTANVTFAIRDGLGTILATNFFGGSIFSISPVSTGEFVAATTNIESINDSFGQTINGNGTKQQTFLTLCEIPSVTFNTQFN